MIFLEKKRKMDENLLLLDNFVIMVIGFIYCVFLVKFLVNGSRYFNMIIYWKDEYIDVVFFSVFVY